MPHLRACRCRLDDDDASTENRGEFNKKQY